MGVAVPPAVKIRNLSFRYRKSSEDALKQVTLEVERGEIFGLLGPNGGGKTTLFKILSTAYPCRPAEAEILGLDLAAAPGEVRRKIGFVFQSPSLDKKLTVSENLRHHGRLYGLSGRVLEKKIGDILEKVSLSPRSNELVEILSGGLARRVEIAKGLLHSPEVLLMDEPTTGLDPGARMDFWRHIEDIRSSGVTILVTTHLMEEAEKCGRLAILNEGRVVALGSPASLKGEIEGEVVTVEAKNAEAFAREVRGRGDVLSVNVSGRTLEDVFVKKTGHTFWGNGK
ncbi:MAG: hypothetical protein A3A86_01350 [Elusimicrobia bacterium RIFCSPLOWO2_01_FULL_60_11]|nr:MAG: hypothetical protein A3A86_01350 [Elusimicrobia bacterium RIFCSPLOWO2_01_FULL_60_11]